jgi:hypothetical protein
MSNQTFDENKLERLKECATPQEALSVLLEDGAELSEEQLEAVVGGVSSDVSIEKLIDLFSDAFSSLFSEEFDAKDLISSLPSFAGH